MAIRLMAQLNHKPNNPENMILVTAFQKLVLTEGFRVEIAMQGVPNMKLPFNNTWANKIFSSIWKNRIIRFISKIPERALAITCMLKLYSIWQQRSAKALVYKVLTEMSLVGRGIFFVIAFPVSRFIYDMLQNQFNNIVAQCWVKKIKDHPIQNNLFAHNQWWWDNPGNAVYQRSINNGNIGMAIVKTVAFVNSHSSMMEYDRRNNRNILHVWDDDIKELLDPPNEEEQATLHIALSPKQICASCRAHLTDTTRCYLSP